MDKLLAKNYYLSANIKRPWTYHLLGKENEGKVQHTGRKRGTGIRARLL
jgi:hypothetical protein